MGLNWAQIRDNAIVFQDRWKNASGNERSEAQTFVYELLRDVYEVDPRRVATFEQKVHPTTDTNGYIDMFWPGRILIEMKSKAFHQKLAMIRILDPACGCGNFLVVSYMLLRRLEIEVIRAKYPKNEDLPELFNLNEEIIVNVNQFYGFDIEDFPCQIAIAGMWLIDHKMNVEAAKEFGRPFIRIPLSEKANIYNIDALKTDCFSWMIIPFFDFFTIRVYELHIETFQ